MIVMAKSYKIRPSQILNIKNDYDAFCFDEACEFIAIELSKEDHKEPKWIEKNEDINNKAKDNKATIEWMMKHNKAL